MFDKFEPSASMRGLTRGIWELFVALRKDGFNEQQALTIVGQILAASIAASAASGGSQKEQ